MAQKNNLKQWLEQNADLAYAKFSLSLIPNETRKMYGIRRPILNKKAVEFADTWENISNDSCEEVLLKAYAVGHIKDIQTQLAAVQKFVPLISTWENCDTFCSALKSAKKYPSLFWPLLVSYSQSSSDYEQRFAYVMMLKYFCTPDYIDSVLRILLSAKPKIWDTKQSIAWALAECFIKFEDKTNPLLKNLTPELRKLTRRKIFDSKRVSVQTKQGLKNENPVDFA